MKASRFLTKADAITFRRREDKLLGYPARGTQANGSSHPRVATTWDGTGAPPVGWTAQHAKVQKHPVRAEWVVDVHGIADALADGRATRLTTAERTALQALLAAAAELDNTWDNAREDELAEELKNVEGIR
jgi:hypothetical protein